MKSLQDPHALIPDGPVLLSVTVFEVEQQTMPESRNSAGMSEVNPVNDGMFKDLWQDERECCVESLLDAAQHLPAHQTEGEVAVHCDSPAINPAFQSHGVSTSSQDPQRGSERVDRSRSSLVSHVEKAFDDVCRPFFGQDVSRDAEAGDLEGKTQPPRLGLGLKQLP